ncbi:hypothetical protein C9374_007057 [Naegleria lovaniensis]|uniref:Adenylate and Guanylate cyclase catalytic domain containing protein n=1 Tax=Naegleria lovaniensis TaxID=51637 RepID=A0AA88H493_NAELO|nr:uncharacterized protein C9374_007057 [Naegleria lovaniensis]KAG2393526.1 hypothetical protein C9374_007057 [Naegleria lovaniensis]
MPHSTSAEDRLSVRMSGYKISDETPASPNSPTFDIPNVMNGSIVQNQNSIIGSEGSLSNTTGSDTSIASQTITLTSTTITSLQDKSPKKGWKAIGIHAFLNVYLIWTQLFVTTLRDYQWGEYGNYIFTVLNFPTTFLTHLIPYWAAVGVAVVVVVMIFTYLACIVLAFRNTFKPTKYFKRLKKFVNHYSLLLRTFSLFFTYVLVGFFDCNISKTVDVSVISGGSLVTTSMQALNRFPTVACAEASNMAMMITSSVSILVLLVLVPVSELIITNSNPHSKTSLLIENSVVPCLMNICSLLQLLVAFVVPQQYSYGSAAFHVVLSLLMVFVMLYCIPFLRRFENALYFGFVCARAAASVGSLISASVNAPVISDDMGAGFAGMTIGLMVIAFISGAVVMELYTRIQLHRMRDFFLQAAAAYPQTETEKNFIYVIEKLAVSMYVDLEESGKLSLLRLFLKLCLKNGKIRRVATTSDASEEYFDSDIALAFIKGVAQQKSFSDMEVLTHAAKIVQFKLHGDSNSSVFAQTLLQRAMKQHPNMVQKFFIQERMREVEVMSQSSNNLFDVATQIEKLSKNQNMLLSLHRDFWKELAGEQLNYASIEKINRKIFTLTSECKTILTSLFFNYSNNKTVLRLYANFAETFEFNKELAQSLFSEANTIEEEEMRKRRRKMSVNTSHYQQRKGNKITPSEGGGKYEVSSNFEEDQDLHSATEEDSQSLQSAFDSPQAKKESLFRQAIAVPKSHRASTLFSVLYFALAFAIIIASIGLSIYYSRSVKVNVPNLQEVCLPGNIPNSVLRNIRAAQNWINVFYLFEYPWPAMNEGFPTVTKQFYIVDHKSRLASDVIVLKKLLQVGQKNVFDSDIYSDYSSNIYTMQIPNEDSTQTSVYTGTSSIRNTSIVEITNMMIKYTEALMSQYPDTLLLTIEHGNMSSQTRNQMLNQVANHIYFNPTQNYNYMFLWLNRNGFTSAFETFCQRYLDRSVSIISNSVFQFALFVSISLGIFLVISAMYFVYIVQELRIMGQLVKLFEYSLPKDVVGKIFHHLSKRTEYEAATNVNTFALNKYKPNITLVASLLLITISVCCCGVMVFIESYWNAQISSRVMSNVRLTIQAASTLQRLAFEVGEINTYYAVSEISKPNSVLAYQFNRTVTYGDMRLWPNRKNLDILFERVLNRTLSVSTSITQLVYGDGTSQPVLGIYPTVDKLITIGMDNCTDYMIKNNISYTYASNLLYCKGLESVLTDFLSACPQVSTDSRKQYIEQQKALVNGTLLDQVPMAMKHNNLMRMSLPLITKFVTFISEFVKASSDPSSTVVIVASIFGIVVASLCVIVFSIFSSIYWNQLHCLRMMINYVPVEVMMKNESLRNFIMYHSVDKKTKKKSSRKQRAHVEDAFNDMKIIFNSSVEGTMMCKQNGEVEVFNNAGLRMFGLKLIDILGRPMYELFDPACRDSVKKKVERLFATHKHESSHNLKEIEEDEVFTNQLVETIELDCIRKNQTKFPAKINIYVVKLDSKDACSIVATFKDITSEKKQTALLNEEKQKSDNLLKNILPTTVANRLKGGDSFIAEKFDDITCFFSDMVGFTKISSNLQASDLVLMLNAIVNGFDALTEKYDLEKIKTIGDAYFCVGGLHNSLSDHPERVLKFAIETFGVIHHYNSNKHIDIPDNINIRVGINTGPVVAGVIGSKKFAYDLWGDTINVASRMESTSLNGRIQVSRSTYARVFDLGYEFEEREVDVKGKGTVKTYLLNAKHHDHVVFVQQQQPQENALSQLRNTSNTTDDENNAQQLPQETNDESQ